VGGKLKISQRQMSRLEEVAKQQNKSITDILNAEIKKTVDAMLEAPKP
jgi:hypothetical protein